ncbi:MAG: hypothetical protein GY717_21535 [Rhodobacteraceae bacterium]|nr:hypothetical protein [Paracoccaceae bacterium]
MKSADNYFDKHRPADADTLTRVIAAAYAVYSGLVDDLPDVAAGLGSEIGMHSVLAAFDDETPLGVAALVRGENAHLANSAKHPGAGGKGVANGEERQQGGCAKAALRPGVPVGLSSPGVSP